MGMKIQIQSEGLKEMQEKIHRLLEVLTEANQIIDELEEQEVKLSVKSIFNTFK